MECSDFSRAHGGRRLCHQGTRSWESSTLPPLEARDQEDRVWNCREEKKNTVIMASVSFVQLLVDATGAAGKTCEDLANDAWIPINSGYKVQKESLKKFRRVRRRGLAN